jgi:hypothetical protein
MAIKTSDIVCELESGACYTLFLVVFDQAIVYGNSHWTLQESK